MLFFFQSILALVCEMIRVCLMNRCSPFCMTCGLRLYFLHFIQTFTLKSKWFFSPRAFHDAHHCNIWIAPPKIINLPSQHPWAVQVFRLLQATNKGRMRTRLNISSIFRVLNLRHPKTLSGWALFVSLFRHKLLSFWPLFPNCSPH